MPNTTRDNRLPPPTDFVLHLRAEYESSDPSARRRLNAAMHSIRKLGLKIMRLVSNDPNERPTQPTVPPSAPRRDAANSFQGNQR